ncbi:MAG: hypothetical protein OXH57_03495 [Ekhidna sp.]|nr:hypothetical protein [Ekhidna sp.]
MEATEGGRIGADEACGIAVGIGVWFGAVGLIAAVAVCLSGDSRVA